MPNWSVRLSSATACEVETEGRVEAVRHDFTHFTLVIHPRLVRVVGSAAVSEGGAIWCADVELGTAPLPAPMRRIVLALARRGSAAASHLKTECCFR